MSQLQAKDNDKTTQYLKWGYIVLVIAIGVAISVDSCLRYTQSLIATERGPLFNKEIMDLIALTAMSALFRSMPVYYRNDQTMDLSIITVFASMLLKGRDATVVTVILSIFFTFESSRSGDERRHVFNTPVYKTLFNNANLIISLTVGSVVFTLLGGEPGETDAIKILLPSLGFLLPAFFLNAGILMGLFTIMKQVKFLNMLGSLVRSFLPNLLATAPLGYFLCRFMSVEKEGYLMAALFILPLMFARYAFKLYLDSKEQFYKTIRTLTAAIEARDKYTEGHSRRVEMYSEGISNQLKLPSSIIEDIKVAALLHDIGKIGIEDRILRKPGKLDTMEMDQIRDHPRIGLFILEDVDMPRSIKDTILYHHVYYDGRGYPKVEPPDKEVPLSAFIVALADAYDAMTSNRPYRDALPLEVAVEIIRENSGTQFHPVVVGAFIEMLKKEGKIK